MSTESPIFIVGTERSGTNLLRMILNTHSQIAVPHPPHIMKNFFALEPKYGDLTQDAAFKKLIGDVVKSIELHTYPWDFTIDQNEVFNKALGRDLFSVFAQTYDQYLRFENKETWCCKSTFMIRHIAEAKKYYPKAKFIYMVRDGRDVSVSARKSIFNHFNIWFTAHLWREEQRTALYWLNKLGKEQVHLLPYEDLLTNSENTVKGICGFLGKDFEPEMLNYFETKEAAKSSAISDSWKNTSQPIMRKNFGKYKKSLSKEEILIFESVCFQEMDQLGYELENDLVFLEGMKARYTEPTLRQVLDENMTKFQVQFKAFLSDKNNLKRYKKYWHIKLAGLKQSLF